MGKRLSRPTDLRLAMRYDDRSLAGILFILGAVQFLLAMLVSEGSLPQYSVSTNAISDLGVGPTAALFNTSVAFLGLLSLGGVYFYHRTEKALWITIPFLLASIGPIGVGLFPERNSVSNALHGSLRSSPSCSAALWPSSSPSGSALPFGTSESSWASSA